MLLKNVKLNGEITDIEISNGKITAIGQLKNSDEIIDLKGAEVYSGLIDVHSHSCIGIDTMDVEGLEEMCVYEAQNGITSWLPTTVTMGYEAIKNVTNRDISNLKGAQVLGFHLEGPYINKKYKGAQNEEFIKNPALEEINALDNVKMITVAPEIEGAMEFIKNCGKVVALGHTDADYETGVRAFKNGALCLTHTFNAMPPFHHRNPSVIGAAIECDGYVQVICDGIHLHKSVVIALYRIFGSERMVLISDSMRATGMEDGEYDLGGQMVTVENGIARTKEGALAGSTTNLFNCVRKAIEFGIPKQDAFKMASLTPANLIGEPKKGKIEVGADADIIAVDENLNLMFSMVKGEIYKNKFHKG